jgi:hypothetical protein
MTCRAGGNCRWQAARFDGAALFQFAVDPGRIRLWLTCGQRWLQALGVLRMARLLSMIFLLLVSGCGLPPPPEFVTYQAAFAEADAATTKVLDEYNRVEKAVTQTDAFVLNPDQAALIVEGADAPNTALYRRGFAAVREYNIILARYAAGDSIAVLRPELDRLKTSLGTIGGMLPFVPDLAKTDAVFGAFEALTKIGLAQSDAAEFERSVLEGAPIIIAFLKEVRNTTPDMYNDYVIAKSRISSVEGIRQSQQELKAARVMLASWVLLIDETSAAIERLQTAVAEGGSRRSNLGTIASAAERISGYAGEVQYSARLLRDGF